MDLTVLKNYFDACFKAETQLQAYWNKFQKLSSFAIFKLLAPQSQPKIDATLIRNFVISFNWQAILNKVDLNNEQSNYKIHSFTSDMNVDQLLDFGLDLLVSYWGTNKSITFDEFSLLVKGQHELPVKDKQIPFPQKKQIFQCLMNEIQNLIYIQQMKKKVYYQYKNLSDLFQTVTQNKNIQYANVERLFLSFGDRKNEKQIQKICKRARTPWNFNTFLALFKRNVQNKTQQTQIHYSARRNKDKDNYLDKSAFTTPRRQKYLINQSSTKVTKGGQLTSQIYATPTKQINLTQPQTGYKEQPQQNYIQILATLLSLQQQFINDCINLVKRKDCDLQLVYERHGKKFEKLLNQRYGVCNFSAFVRFFVPRDFQHRYLSFIRYQANDTLSTQTQALIDDLLQKYLQKQSKIKQLWKNCDKQLLHRYFCRPSEINMRNQKLREIFTTRQTKILLQRLDPHQKGYIQLSALN